MGEGELGPQLPIEHSVARAEAYLHAKFYLGPSNRLVNVRDRTDRIDRQDRQTDNGLIA